MSDNLGNSPDQELKPKMGWDSEVNYGPGLVWSRIYRDRFQIEVWHNNPDPQPPHERAQDRPDYDHNGRLLIFDHEDDDKLFGDEQVFLGPYAVDNGPDDSDVEAWLKSADFLIDVVLPTLSKD